MRCSGGDVPQAHRFIATSRGKQLTVRTERHPEDVACMAGKWLTVRFARCNVPQSYRTVGTGGGEQPSIGTEGHSVYCTGVTRERRSVGMSRGNVGQQ